MTETRCIPSPQFCVISSNDERKTCVAGAMFDLTQNYDYSFVMMGLCVFISGAMLYPIPCIQRLRARRDNADDVALGKVPISGHSHADEQTQLRAVDA